jgi:hypothetical protein
LATQIAESDRLAHHAQLHYDFSLLRVTALPQHAPGLLLDLAIRDIAGQVERGILHDGVSAGAWVSQ